MSGLARRGGQAGFTAAEFVLGVCVIVVPVALLVLALPTWSERQSMAQRAAVYLTPGTGPEPIEQQMGRALAAAALGAAGVTTTQEGV